MYNNFENYETWLLYSKLFNNATVCLYIKENKIKLLSRDILRFKKEFLKILSRYQLDCSNEIFKSINKINWYEIRNGVKEI